MRSLRRRSLGAASWIPLRAVQPTVIGKHGYLGYQEEFFGAGSLAVHLDQRSRAAGLDWESIGPSQEHEPWMDDTGRYVPSDVYQSDEGGALGVRLVLSQRGNQAETRTWHLHQDLVIALMLKREGDVWVAVDEGYVEVARLHRANDSRPVLLEIRAEHLRDYLCARGMALRIATFRSRATVEADASHIGWSDGKARESSEDMRWEGTVMPIHEGGGPHGGETAVFHSRRTDVDLEADVPVIGAPTESGVESKSWVVRHEGPKFYWIQGELWRNEWVEPSVQSVRVRRDEPSRSEYFITDVDGSREGRDTLREAERWLWFAPTVIGALLQYRGSSLEWYTRDTGNIRCTPDDNVHFGVNRLGLVNVFAADIVRLSDWEQRIWAGHNRVPDGGVSDELLASQVSVDPAETQAPEAFLGQGIDRINRVAVDHLGAIMFREHASKAEILAGAHRFRSTTTGGFLALAKDLARLTADSLDAAAIVKLSLFPMNEKLGSLKILERLLAVEIGSECARALMGPLFGIYDLRHADAHLPRAEWTEALHLAGVERSAPQVVRGYQLLAACVTCLFSIAGVLERFPRRTG